MRAHTVRMVLGREGVCHSFLQGKLCRSANQTYREVNLRRRKLQETDLEWWYKLETAGRIQRNGFGSEPELLGGLGLHTCRRLPVQMLSTEQPGLSREREFAKHSFKNIFIIIGYKQRHKRIDQSKSGGE